MLTGYHGEAQWWTPHDFHGSKPTPTNQSKPALEQVTGFEPVPSAWQAEILPLYYTCVILDLMAPGARVLPHFPTIIEKPLIRRQTIKVIEVRTLINHFSELLPSTPGCLPFGILASAREIIGSPIVKNII